MRVGDAERHEDRQLGHFQSVAKSGGGQLDGDGWQLGVVDLCRRLCGSTTPTGTKMLYWGNGFGDAGAP
jgi:hypothetical protein